MNRMRRVGIDIRNYKNSVDAIGMRGYGPNVKCQVMYKGDSINGCTRF